MTLVVCPWCPLRPARLAGTVLRFGAAMGCLLAATTAAASDTPLAQQAADAVAGLQRQADQGAVLVPEVSTVRTRLGTTMVPALQMPDGRSATDLAGVDYRLWMTRGRAGIGFGVGTLGYVQPAPGGRTDGPLTLTGSAPTVSVALRMRMTRESAVYADATGAMGLGPDPDAGYVNTKVGVEWQPAKSRFGFEGGRLALQLDSGYKISLRARKGGIGLYLRGQF
jgi:hypothetical protein